MKQSKKKNPCPRPPLLLSPLQGTNALLESPTGTGKTLCLLCAALAWRASTAAPPPAPAADAPSSSSWAAKHAAAVAAATAAAPAATRPPIIYASRTHSQLKQVIGELRRTAYKPRAVVLGSRSHLCANAAVASAPSAAACNQACAAAVRTGACSFYTRVDSFLRDNPDAHSTPLDVEDLASLGPSRGACPFYVSRGLAPTADIVFVPYNYLVDPRSRGGLRALTWRGSVIVFDEAHNLESAAADAASFELSAPSLAAAIDDATTAATAAQRRAEAGGGVGGPDGDTGGRGGAARARATAPPPPTTASWPATCACWAPSCSP